MNKKEEKLIHNLEVLVKYKNSNELRKKGSDSNLMANHNQIAEQYLIAATKLGDTEAYTDLGVLYNHHFKKPNREKGFEYYLKAARLGDKRAIGLYVRDSAWFDYHKDIDEIMKLAVKYKETSGSSMYAYSLINSKQIDEGIQILEAIKDKDPNILIDLAILDIQALHDEELIIDRLIEFTEFYIYDVLQMYSMNALGDDNWFLHYGIWPSHKNFIMYSILIEILKKAADKGNHLAALTFSFFTFVGICMSEPDLATHKIYFEKAFEGGLPFRHIFTSMFERAEPYEEGRVIHLEEGEN
jgi:TPR repeat protein